MSGSGANSSAMRIEANWQDEETEGSGQKTVEWPTEGLSLSEAGDIVRLHKSTVCMIERTAGRKLRRALAARDPEKENGVPEVSVAPSVSALRSLLMRTLEIESLTKDRAVRMRLQLARAELWKGLGDLFSEAPKEKETLFEEMRRVRDGFVGSASAEVRSAARYLSRAMTEIARIPGRRGGGTA